MIAQKLSAVLVPKLAALIKGTGVLLHGLAKAAGLGAVKFLTHAVTDVPVLAGGAAICWGIHFWSVPSAWIAGGVMMVVFMAVSVKPLR